MFLMSREEFVSLQLQIRNTPHINLLGHPRLHNNNIHGSSDTREVASKSEKNEPVQHMSPAKSPRL